LGGAVDDVKVRDEVIKFEVGVATCKHTSSKTDVTCGNPLGFHVMNELLTDCVGEGSLDIEEEGDCNFAGAPSILYLVGDKMHGVSGVPTRSAFELARREHVVFFS
jgi:hypothetical protein